MNLVEYVSATFITILKCNVMIMFLIYIVMILKIYKRSFCFNVYICLLGACEILGDYVHIAYCSLPYYFVDDATGVLSLDG